MERRDFCRNLLMVPIAGTLLSALNGCSNVQRDDLFATAASDHSGQHFVVIFNVLGEVRHQVAISNRAHDLVKLDQDRVLAVSRRPFTKLFEIDLPTGRLIREVDAQPGMHFYGHGVLDKKRNQLITTENEITSGKGKLVFRDGKTLAVINVIDSGGIGPHQCALLHQEDTLVVANGGILTHPEQGRKKLNLATMAPNLSYFSLESNELLEQAMPPHHQLSLRHFSVSSDDKVIIGAQYQGHYRDKPPLIFAHRRGEMLTPLSASPKQWQGFKHYTASVAIDSRARVIAVSSPRGGVVGFWHLDTLDALNEINAIDCAGAAFGAGGFMFSNGKGQLQHFTDDLSQPQMRKAGLKLRFDNHIIALA